MPRFFHEPFRDQFLIAFLFIALGVHYFFPIPWILFPVALVGAIPTFIGAVQGISRGKINIDTFNTFALIVSFATKDGRTAAFIVLMLAFARLLDWRTQSRMHNAVEELLKLKPQRAFRERRGKVEEIAVEKIKTDDTLVIKDGDRVPVDGVIIFGRAQLNESSVTGESSPVKKMHGDTVLAGTLNESGVIKIKATHVGKDSTIERMAALMREASSRKSHAEKIADRFAALFLPAVALLGLGVYWITKDPIKMASIFLVACADDMAVALPLAMNAALGMAAKRGVIIKGGESLEILAKLRQLVLDKTGTLTYGKLAIHHTEIAKGVPEAKFWSALAAAEKYSEHPIGRAIFRGASKHIHSIPDPDDYGVQEGGGVWAKIGTSRIVLGNEKIFRAQRLPVDKKILSRIELFRKKGYTAVILFINRAFAGIIAVADAPRPEAANSIHELRELGVKRITMFTGDNESVANEIAGILGISEFRASMNPEDKLRALEVIQKGKNGFVGMVGDGVNDAPALARADIGIAMGSGGTAVAVEAADVVITTDNLLRLPEIIKLSRRTFSVIRSDIWIWAVSNMLGFALVLFGFAGPAFAAFYNFAADFFPLINSSRLFRDRDQHQIAAETKNKK
ncbi:MAG TPA: cation-translocating P-type ATPase [Patescibacteria group bacterium]|nr:cation-translocating P-type ATPase [Patescibacteria group bacterium]